MTKNERMQQAAERRAKIVAMKAEGMTNLAIALRLGVSESRVGQILKRAAQDAGRPRVVAFG